MASRAVTKTRWERAQEWELAFWRRAETRHGWKRIAYPIVRPVLGAVGSGKVVGDDWNGWWRDGFDGYSFLPDELGDYIELGCGPYTNTRLILHGRRAARVVCSDPLAGEYLKFRDRWLSRAQRKGLVEVDDHPIEETTFPPNSFDTVVLINVLDHVRDVDLCFENALALLRPGGWFVFGQDLAKAETADVPNYEWFEEGHPHRIGLADIEAHLASLNERYRRLIPARDTRLQSGVFAFAGVRRDP